MRMLLVEDDPKLGKLLHYKLEKEFHSVDWAQDAANARAYIEAAAYDVYILDWMIPGESGVSLCRSLRSDGDSTPILMLTARDAVPDRVEGIMAGADDYLVKPFAFEELFARLHALGRRRMLEWTGDRFELGGLILNKHTRHVERDGRPLLLTRREFQLLSYLAENAGQVVSRDQILNAVWGWDADVTPNAIDAAIKLLRRKVDDPFEHKLIQSVRGLGYRLSAAGEV